MPSVCSNCVGVEVGDGLMYVPPERFPRARSGGCFALPGARRPPGAEPLPARDSEPDTGNRRTEDSRTSLETRQTERWSEAVPGRSNNVIIKGNDVTMLGC